MDRPTGHRPALVVGLVLMVLLAVAPLFYLQHLAGQKASDSSYQDLVAVAKDHNGDATYSRQAAEASRSVKVVKHGSEERGTWAERSEDGTCWVLDIHPGTLRAPRVGVDSDCRP